MTTSSSATVPPADGYAAWAQAYLDAGWRGVLPLPEGMKLPPPTSYTGQGTPDPDAAQIAAWARSPRFERGNLALRLPPNVIALDVDNHDGKPAAETIAALERAAGVPLPQTWTSTSRSDGSCHAFYRVSLLAGDRGWPGSLKQFGPGVDLLQTGHRYSLVWPSTNPANDGAHYRWYRPDGSPAAVGEIPRPEDLTELPQSFIDAITAPRSISGEKATEAEATALLDRLAAHPDYRAPMSERMAEAVADAIEQFPADGHGTMVAVQGKVIRYAELGDAGLGMAYALLRAGFIAAVTERYADRDTRGDGESVAAREFDKAWIGAGRTVAGDLTPQRELDGLSLARAALAPGGAWHPNTPGGVLERARISELVPEDDNPPSWAPVDLAGALDADPPLPMCLVRSDGVALMYPGKVHSVHGESESGKSWLVQYSVVQALLAGGAALYVDFESDARDVAGRLIAMGVPRSVLLDSSRFAYVRPEVDTSMNRERVAFEAILACEFTVAVIDGVTDSMGMYGYSIKDNDDIARWLRELPRAIARRTGAAVAMVDHVTKDPEGRGRNAIGGQHKMAGVDGAAFVVEPRTAFAVGIAGVISVRIAKDRAGEVRRHGGAWRKSDRTQPIAEFHLDATEQGRIAARLEAPENAGAVGDVDRTKPGAPTGEASERVKFRPTYFMEKVSLYWEETEFLSERSTSKTVTAMCQERKDANKPLKRDKWRDAITLLVEEGYATFVVGARDAHEHTVVKPYRQATDPLADQYSEAVARAKGKLEFTTETDPEERPGGPSEDRANDRATARSSDRATDRANRAGSP
ncbi:Bifunctional DNA primase/polymerase OS=Tsukamurella paurometabola (strain ATCC 8368 / DSM /CCUG 35730 / CIP 100753 / JCM 10117 / KCTC 9821 / NBRC 16120/ NCIMB 702349 / NCTC 13040) OX=521096 GN=Tpau_1426 PE=4 SV=1 [Tsukamurella paurometabola]|uniref:Bifunctional DNA primase/polymerase n=1 Tax=Tsukamurella paurometabola (strain ATCC 8368 / DSM 20162 / CCUG 35730 / CIP 100753 / JCM 10117 / KCTC 9821 / NBRC 16120 / NCIMB 702349 / NCTC 13040) TaxID=521096 RepID=D5UXG2_TSUPD|nr:bifunctional DNA primase/polymerase [Tsukamurella paurometabola]ADG78054.1 Bifunctional DNA primase/polymerase [Tsukamurella paurometabola DSM 20162]SUP29965.1 Bifunctional DNA primase/polymerase, N-terminal [Tsukamurella paurometabola]